MMIESVSAASDVAILSRLIFPDQDEFSIAAAQAVLAIQFAANDLDRIHSLVTKNQDDQLSGSEQTELENYRRVGFLLDLMHSKARQVVKTHLATR